VVWFAGRCPSG